MNESIQTLSFTDAALVQFRQFMIENGAYGAKLRISASGGGCSGFQYAFSFVGDVADDDFQMEQGGVPVVVDSSSMQILSGAQIDCVEKGEGCQFVVNRASLPMNCNCNGCG